MHADREERIAYERGLAVGKQASRHKDIEIEILRKTVAELRGQLEPFERIAQFYNSGVWPEYPDDYVMWGTGTSLEITMGTLRRLIKHFPTDLSIETELGEENPLS